MESPFFIRTYVIQFYLNTKPASGSLITMAFLPPPPQTSHFIQEADSVYEDADNNSAELNGEIIIKAVFSGGFAEICFHQNSLEMLHPGRALQTFKIREGVKMERNTVKRQGQKRNKIAFDRKIRKIAGTTSFKCHIGHMGIFRGNVHVFKYDIFAPLMAVWQQVGGAGPGQVQMNAHRAESLLVDGTQEIRLNYVSVTSFVLAAFGNQVRTLFFNWWTQSWKVGGCRAVKGPRQTLQFQRSRVVMTSEQCNAG